MWLIIKDHDSLQVLGTETTFVKLHKAFCGWGSFAKNNDLPCHLSELVEAVDYNVTNEDVGAVFRKKKACSPDLCSLLPISAWA